MNRSSFRIFSVLITLIISCMAFQSASATDRDRDGLPDSWEKSHNLNTSKNDASQDPDRDGLSNLREYKNHTNPRDRDTDNDLLKDGDEVDLYRTNPRSNDSDHDGIKDSHEDSDGDGIDNQHDHLDDGPTHDVTDDNGNHGSGHD